MRYPAAKSRSNHCLARERKKPLGNLSHFPDAAWITTSYRCALWGRCFQVTGSVLVQGTSESSKASNTERQKIDGPIFTPHSTRIALVEKGPVALSAGFHGTRGFFSRSAPFLWFRFKFSLALLQHGIIQYLLQNLEKKINLNWSKPETWFQPCHTSIKFPLSSPGVVTFPVTGKSDLLFLCEKGMLTRTPG